jgi:hypothetical protein
MTEPLTPVSMTRAETLRLAVRSNRRAGCPSSCATRHRKRERSMSALRGRALIEDRYGPLGSGQQSLTIGGVEYALTELMSQMGLNFDDSRAIDALTLPEGCYAVRYFDPQDQRVAVQEFDAHFRLLSETRAHSAEWLGEEAYFSLFSGH